MIQKSLFLTSLLALRRPTARGGENSLYVELTERFGAGCFVGIVSRLDKPVSGVVIFGKNKSATAK